MNHWVAFAKVAAQAVNGISQQIYTYEAPEYAYIKPTGTQFFFQGFNTESEITHTVFTHYRRNAHTYDYLVEYVILPGDEHVQERQYEIMRTTDFNGYQVYTRLDVKMLDEK